MKLYFYKIYKIYFIIIFYILSKNIFYIFLFNFLVKKKRMAMLDTLIAAQNNGQQIDDVGIREEVDTFIFEVNHSVNNNYNKNKL